MNPHSGIREPRDLAGRRIGVGLYTQTAAIWIRGLLAREYDVDLSGVTWVQGAIDRAGPHGSPKVPPLLKPVRIEQNTSDRSLGQLLVAGELDALTTGTVPKLFGKTADIVRLFPDFHVREREYYLKHRIHPIMHIVAIKKDVYERNSWIGPSLFKAFVEAKQWALDRMRYTGVTRYMLPWMFDELEELDKVFGPDPWPYGVEPNRSTLEALVDLMVEQGLISSPIQIEDLFVPLGGPATPSGNLR
jgi:4,5-dihydroxyphthalate decarboxylase